MITTWSIFTKPWKNKTPDELGQFVSSLGFNGVEFPVRPEYQVEPADAEKGLERLAGILANYGVKISSVASVTDENVFAGCQAAGCKILRIMAPCDRSKGFYASVDELRSKLYALQPLCEKYGVTVGVQQHYGYGVFNTMELNYLLRDMDTRYVGAIWDAAHSALSGEIPEQALEIIYDKLCLVNLKTAYQRRINGPEAAQAEFKPYFTTGCNGQASWKAAAEYLKMRGYSGDICMPAEYTDEANVEQYIAKDVVYAKSLF